MKDNDVILLSKGEMPRKWYNIMADMKIPLEPPLHPGTKQPMTPKEMEAIFPANLLEQEMSRSAGFLFPEEVLNVLSLWRPTPLVRARRLEQALDTPAQIWYKNESLSPPGSHKPNTSVAQAYFNKVAGVKRLATETGAGQWGSALAFACFHFGQVPGVYGQSQLPAKTLPKIHDEPVAGGCYSQSEHPNRGRQKDSGTGSQLSRKPGYCHQRGN